MRLRTEYSVGSELKFLANLDMMHLMERSLRRANIAYALSEGFNPHIKLSMGTVLPVGVWGEKEYFDLEIIGRISPAEFMTKMEKALPSSLELKKCMEIRRDTPALMKKVNAASYVFQVESGEIDLNSWKDSLLAQPSLLVKSRGKKKNLDKELRLGIYRVEVNQSHVPASIEFWVNVGEPVNVRYDELWELLVIAGIEEKSIIDVYRSANYIREGDKFLSPLEKVI